MAEEFKFNTEEGARVFEEQKGKEIVSANEAAASEVSKQITAQADKSFQDFNQDDIDAYLGKGGPGDPNKIPSSLKSSLDALKKQRLDAVKLTENILKTIDHRVSLTGDYTVDTSTTTDQGRINNSALKAVDDAVIKKYANGETDPQKIIDKLNEAADKLNKKADSEPDPNKRSTLKTIGKYLVGFVLVGGTIVGTILGILHGMALHDTGCYWIKTDVTGKGTELDCTQKNGLQTNCDCSTIDKLKSVNLCDVDPTHTCENKYQYVYQQFDIYNEFNKIVSGIGGDAEDIAAFIQKIIAYITKYGPLVLLGILILIVLPLIISLFRSFS